MRLSTRLVLTYGLLLLVVGGALVTAIPRATEGAVLRYTADILTAQVESLTARPALVLGLLRAARSGSEPGAGTESDPALADALLVNANGVVVRAFAEDVPFPEGSRLPARLAALVRRADALDRAFGAPLGRSGYVAAAAPLEAAPPSADRGSRLSLVVFRPVQDLRPAIRRVQRVVLVWTLAGLALAVAAAAVIGGGLARRLARIGRAAGAMAEGRLDLRVPVEGGPELRELSASFNRMAERLQQTITGLRRSEQLRRDLVASLAHDLRTPVTSILGFAEALRDGVVRDPAQRDRYHSVIAYEAARLSRLIGDLFDFARMQAGQVEFHMRPIAVAPWLGEFGRAAQARAEAQGRKLVVLPVAASGPSSDASQSDTTVLADGDRLAQALGNLVDNALRHSPPDRPVTLFATVDAHHVRFCVADEGPGVPEEERERIWDLYQRGSRKGGSGLGLAIVRSIAAAHGGEVGVESPPGGGARFWFTIPVANRLPNVHDSATGSPHSPTTLMP